MRTKYFEPWFLGVSDKESQGDFRYLSNGRRVTFSNWAKNEPNDNGGAEDFVIMFSSGKWNDVSQSMRTKKTLCLKPHNTAAVELSKALVLIKSLILDDCVSRNFLVSEEQIVSDDLKNFIE